MVYERLDRVYGSEEWIHKHPNAITLNLPIMVSDHSPVLFLTNPSKPKKNSLIKLEAWCFDMPEIRDLIKGGWRVDAEGSPMFRLNKQLKSMRFQIFKWCRDFRERRGIIWDDFTGQCEAVQLEEQDEMYGAREKCVKEKNQRANVYPTSVLETTSKRKMDSIRGFKRQMVFQKG